MDTLSVVALVISIVALLGSVFTWTSLRRRIVDQVTPEEASRAIKKFAEKQKVRIELTEEQMQVLTRQWRFDPRYPAEITFAVRDRVLADIKVASCAYWGDTCCASPLPYVEKGDPPP